MASLFLTPHQEAWTDDTETTDSELKYGVNRGEGYLIIIGNEDAIQQRELDIAESKLNDDDPTNDASNRMIRDLGGMSEYYKFLDRADPDEISALKAAYGVETVDLGGATENENSRQTRDSSPEEIALLFRERCPKVYDPEVRGKEYEYHGNTFKIDYSGRPALASTSLWHAPYAGGQIPANCAATVRSMGKLDDDAGHLIPKAKGGPAIRANLVPQNSKLNQDTWNHKFEKTMLNCARDPSIWGGYYTVEPIYSINHFRPNQLKVSMRTWSWDRDKILYAEFYIHNDHPDWHDGHARKAGKKWQETFSSCKP